VYSAPVEAPQDENARPTADGQCRTSTEDGVMIVRVEGRSTLENHRELAAHLRDFAAARPGELACVVVMKIPGSTPPEEPARRAIVEAMQALGPRLRGIAWVVEGRAPIQFAARAFLRGVAKMVPVACPSKVSAHVDGAIAWAKGTLRG
jgi:hypothetical protein